MRVMYVDSVFLNCMLMMLYMHVRNQMLSYRAVCGWLSWHVICHYKQKMMKSQTKACSLYNDPMFVGDVYLIDKGRFHGQ